MITHATYEPTPEEIAAACLEFQRTWDADEFIRRRRMTPKLSPSLRKPPHLRHNATSHHAVSVETSDASSG